MAPQVIFGCTSLIEVKGLAPEFDGVMMRVALADNSFTADAKIMYAPPQEVDFLPSLPCSPEGVFPAPSILFVHFASSSHCAVASLIIRRIVACHRGWDWAISYLGVM